MAQEKLTMKKGDVESAISRYVLKNYERLKNNRPGMPSKLKSVLTTIQPDREYTGVGTYNVCLDIYGMVPDENGLKENEHYGAQCTIHVSMDSDESPQISINEKLYLTKKER